MTLYSDAVLADSPRTYYRFNEPANSFLYVDSAGNSSDIEMYIAPEMVSGGRNSISGNARSISSGTPSLAVPQSFTGITGFTFETWFKSSKADESYTLVESLSSSTNIEVLVEISPSPSDNLELLLKFGLGIGTWDINTDSTHRHVFVHSDPVTADLFDGRWHHIVCSWVGTSGLPWHGDQLYIYVDGIRRDVPSTRSEFADSLTIAPLTIEGQVHVGGPKTSPNYGEAALDDLALYAYGLSSAKVINHFNKSALVDSTIELDTPATIIRSTNGVLETTQEIDSAGRTFMRVSDLTFQAQSEITVASETSDMLSAREILDVSGSIPVNLSGATLEPNEPNQAGFSKTVWFELPVNPDAIEQMRITLSSPTSSGRVTIYKQPSLDEVEDFDELDSAEQTEQDPMDSEPSFNKLVRVKTAAADQVFTLDPEYGSSYFLQVGLLSGVGDDFELTWGDSSPDEGGSFDNPVLASYAAGSTTINTTNAWLESGEPSASGVTETRSVWVQWTAPSVITAPTVLKVEPSSPGNPYAVGVYTGTLIDALAQQQSETNVDGTTIELSFTAVPDTVYYFRIGSTAEALDYTVTWGVPKKDYPPAEPITQLRVTVHAGVAGQVLNGRTYKPNEMITELPNRMGAQFQERLNVPGSGSVTLMQNDMMIRAFNPDKWPTKDNDPWVDTTQSMWGQDPFQLVQMGNIVKFWMFNSTKGEGGKEDCVSAFLIKSREISVVGSGEDGDRMITVSGPTVHQLLNDFVVLGENGPNRATSENRAFNWTSVVGRGDKWEDGGWFSWTGNHATARRSWNHPINHSAFAKPPGWRKKRNQAYKKRPKYALVARKKKPWPDKKAEWMWMTSNRNYNQNKTFPRKGYSHKGMHYYRAKSFNITKTARYRFVVYCDTSYWIYLDGKLIMSGNGNETYNKYKVVTKTISKTIVGQNEHSLAVFVQDTTTDDYDHNDAFLMTVQRLNSKGKPTTILRSGGNQKWFAYHGERPPQWSRAMILATIIREAKARGNHSANAIALDKDFGQLSEENAPWFDDRAVGTNVEVGTSALSLQERFSESNRFDVHIDPDTLKLRAWQGVSGNNAQYPRGSNKSNNVALVPGHNLVNYTISELDEMKNRLLVKYDGGLVYVTHTSAVYGNRFGHREGYIELGDLKSGVAARERGEGILSWLGVPTTSGGSEDAVGHINEEYSGSIIPMRGSVPFLDFEVGDIISAPSSNGLMAGHRVMSLTCTEDTEGNLAFDPELQGQ